MVLMLLLTILSRLSMLDEELARLRLDVWFEAILVLTILSASSMLEEELERLRLEV